jgi:hypothetical protein
MIPVKFAKTKLLFSFTLFIAGIANAQYVLQGGKLQKTETFDGQGKLGRYTSISEDGNTLVLTGDQRYFNVIYSRVNNVWDTGHALAVTSFYYDMINPVVIAPGADSIYVCSTNSTQRVKCIKKVNGSWANAPFSNSPIITLPQFSGRIFSMAFSHDMFTCIVATDSLKVLIYKNNGTAWQLEGSGFTTADGRAARGYQVDISDDGNTAIIGNAKDSATAYWGVGNAYVVTRENGVWNPIATKIQAPGTLVQNQGAGVGISADGSRIMVQGGYNTYPCASVYDKVNGLWQYVTSLYQPESGSVADEAIIFNADAALCRRLLGIQV